LVDVKSGFLTVIEKFVIAGDNRLISLGNLCFLIVGIFLAKNFVKYVTYLMNTVVEERMIKNIRDTIFRRTVDLSLGFFNQQRSGNLISVLTNDVNSMSSVLTPMVGTVIREPMQALVMLVILLSLSPKLTLIAFSTSILSVIAVRYLNRYIKRYSRRLQTAMSDITSRLLETFQNIRLIKAFSAERYEHARFEERTAWYVRSAFKHSAMANMMGPVGEMFAIIAIAVVLYTGGQEVLTGSMRSDELITFLFLLFAIMQPIVSIVSIPTTMQRGLVAAERFFELMDREPEVVGGTRPLKELSRELQFLNVGFSYQPGRPVVRDVTITVKRGQTLALVGPSGGGKSTLMDLVIRLYDPTHGGIYLDGVDIREFSLEDYRSLFGIVTQESILFHDSVANNIGYGRESISEEELVQAAIMANANEFIVRLPKGYDTQIGDRGVLLSGGQRQRLAIARALARDPQILLFDEATSALDSESEMLVQDAINRILENRTAIVIAHRLSTIKRANMIAVIEEGAIVECGKHEDLLAAGNLYKRLYDAQFQSE
jgi:subfamily B ATP-binding cassette protein MsbA